MSRTSRIALILAGFAFLFFAIPRYFLHGWDNFLFIPLGLFIVLFGFVLVKDFRLFLEFFTMKTTKHGMNMGVLILLTLTLLGTVNYLGAHYLNNLNWDWTKEKLNSLSDQSVKILNTLNSKLDVRFFYSKSNPQTEAQIAQFRNLIQMYQAQNKFIDVKYINSIGRPDLAAQFNVSSGENEVFLSYQGRKQRIDNFNNEEGITTAILRVTHTHSKTIYFVTGHGEKDINATGPTGLSEFKKALQDDQYKVADLKLYETGKVPADAAVVCVIGPQKQFLPAELHALRAYARQGGKLLLALDPGQHHDLANLTKTFGVEFDNNFIVDPAGMMATNTLGIALGTQYMKSNQLTREFSPNMVTLFYLASALQKDPNAPSTLTVDDVVKTDARAMLSDSIPKQGAAIIPNSAGSHTLVMTVAGTLPPGLNNSASDSSPGASKAHLTKSKAAKTKAGAVAKVDKSTKTKGDNNASATEAPKPFSAVIVGDSDFLSNQLLYQQLNRDLALNSVAYLAQDKDLISIRPKIPAGTILSLTKVQQLALLMAYIILPLLLFLTGGAVWFRRKFA